MDCQMSQILREMTRFGNKAAIPDARRTRAVTPQLGCHSERPCATLRKLRGCRTANC
jgi:hypothetical protein